MFIECGVKCGSRELRKAGEVGNARSVELPRAAHENIRRDIVTGSRADVPLVRRFVEPRVSDLRTEADVRHDFVFFGAMVEVALYLGLQRVLAAECRPGLERETVKVRWDVATGTRIGV